MHCSGDPLCAGGVDGASVVAHAHNDTHAWALHGTMLFLREMVGASAEQAELCVIARSPSNRPLDALGDERVGVGGRVGISNPDHFVAIFESSASALVAAVKPTCSSFVSLFFPCLYGTTRLPVGRPAAARISLHMIVDKTYVQRHVQLGAVRCDSADAIPLFWPAVSVDVDGVAVFLPTHYGSGGDLVAETHLFALDAVHALGDQRGGPTLTVYADPAVCYDVSVVPVWISALGALARHKAPAAAGCLFAGALAAIAHAIAPVPSAQPRAAAWYAMRWSWRVTSAYAIALWLAAGVADDRWPGTFTVALGVLLPALVGAAVVVVFSGLEMHTFSCCAHFVFGCGGGKKGRLPPRASAIAWCVHHLQQAALQFS